jgi:hypothetical protein
MQDCDRVVNVVWLVSTLRLVFSLCQVLEMLPLTAVNVTSRLSPVTPRELPNKSQLLCPGVLCSGVILRIWSLKLV